MANIQRIVNGAPAPTAVGVPSSPDPLTSLAQIGTSIASGMEERESVTFYNKARVEGRKALFDIQEEERDNPDYATYADRVTTRFEKTVGSLASGAPNPRAADQIKTQFADWGETAREQATIYSEKQRHAENLDLVREDGDGYAKQVLAGADYTEARTGMVEMILAHAATGNISPDEARAESDALISGLARARFLGAVEDNPYEAKKMLSAGSEIYDDLSADEIVKYENVANAEINRRKEAAKAEQARVISDLEVAIYDETGTYDTNQLDDFEGAVNKLYDSGVMSAPKRTSLMKKINSIRADDGAVGAYTNMIASGVPLSPGDKNARKAVDHFFTTYVAPTLDQEDPAGNNAKMASFVAEVGMIPQSVENTIRGSLRAGDPQTRTLAADLVARISEANPDALTELPKREVDDAIYLTEMIGMGVPADKAIERLDDGKRLTEAERSAARQIAKDDKHSELHAQYTAEKIVRTGFFNDDPKLPAVAQAEFNRIADSEFERTGSIDTAHAVAWKDITRVWAVTSVDGSDRWMKYAPERFGVPGMTTEQNAEWMKRQLATDLGEADGEPVISADVVTAREASQGVPSYQVMVKKDGVLTPYTKDGVPMRWRPDWESSEVRAEMIDAEGPDTAEALRNAKARREEFIRLRTPGESVDPLGLPDSRDLYNRRETRGVQ